MIFQLLYTCQSTKILEVLSNIAPFLTVRVALLAYPKEKFFMVKLTQIMKDYQPKTN